MADGERCERRRTYLRSFIFATRKRMSITSRSANSKHCLLARSLADSIRHKVARRTTVSTCARAAASVARCAACERVHSDRRRAAQVSSVVVAERLKALQRRANRPTNALGSAEQIPRRAREFAQTDELIGECHLSLEQHTATASQQRCSCSKIAFECVSTAPICAAVAAAVAR